MMVVFSLHLQEMLLLQIPLKVFLEDEVDKMEMVPEEVVEQVLLVELLFQQLHQ
tara:strand:+ start:254 stop:415 length:162 start_codon:yes stop_codon:yes gene_type:complete